MGVIVMKLFSLFFLVAAIYAGSLNAYVCLPNGDGSIPSRKGEILQCVPTSNDEVQNAIHFRGGISFGKERPVVFPAYGHGGYYKWYAPR